MTDSTPPFHLSQVRVFPLDQRKSITRLEDLLVPPDKTPPPVDDKLAWAIDQCADHILQAKNKNATVLLFYGAHLLRNGAALILDQMMKKGWLTHLATNGAGSIHDWEYAWLGRSTENVRDNVATGTFGTWDETGRFINLSVQVGAVSGLGYGASLGRMIGENGLEIPEPEDLKNLIVSDPAHPLTAARADLLSTLLQHAIPGGWMPIRHEHPEGSIFASAWSNKVPLTVHPGIGYDIITNHPMFKGAAIGRGAENDFNCISNSILNLSEGVVLSVGSAIMAPQVFEKSLSCVNNIRLQQGKGRIADHSIHVVDLQDGGKWDWTKGEPPKDNPAYYLRFCKTFVRMGGAMSYHECDNLTFMHHLYQALCKKNQQF